MTVTDKIPELLETSQPWLTDGGLETDMLFNHGVDLPYFASFTMLEDEKKRALLEAYFAQYLELAEEAGTGFVLDTCTWRAGKAWLERIGRQDDLERINTLAVEFGKSIRDRFETAQLPIIINGVVGPAGDGYVVGKAMTADQAEASHTPQVQAFAKAGVDIVSAITMNYAEEGIGVAIAAAKANLPVVVSYTVETDGTLPSGQSIADAIEQTDRDVHAATGQLPLYYMINCAHPDHFSDKLEGPADWKTRIGGVRANASRLSHAQLDEAETLDDGNPTEFGELYAKLGAQLPGLKVIGGCCGSDSRHVGCACRALNETLPA